MNWTITLIAFYLLAMLIMALKGFKKTSQEDFLINNRSTRLIPLLFTSLATFVGGGVSIGLITMGYQGGFAAVAIGLSYVLGFILFSFFAKKIHDYGRDENLYSLIGYLNLRFHSNNKSFNQQFSSIVGGINLFIVFFLLAVQFVGIASLLQHFLSIEYIYAVIAACVVLIVYTTVVGLKGVIITDFVQFLLIVLIIIVIYIPGILIDTQNLTKLSTLPTSFINGTSFGWVFLIGLPLFFMPTVFVQMSIWQRVLAAKDGKTARRAMIWSGIGMLPFYIVFPLVGMSVLLTNGDISNGNLATFIFLTNHCNDFTLGIALVGLLAALMSSGDSFLNIISISAIKDFKNWRLNPIEPKTEFKLIKIATIIFGVLALILAILVPDVVDLFVIGSSAIVVFVPATIHSLFKPDVSKYRLSAVLSFVIGFITNLIFFIYGAISPEKFDSKSSFVPAFIISLLVYLISNFVIKNKENDN